MKKHNEGYSLVLVLVVLTLMSLVAAFILSFSLQNLKSQTNAVSRMEDKYAAAGEIEKVVAQLEALIDAEGSTEITLENATISSENGQYFVSITSKSEWVQIDCVIQLVGATVSGPTEGKYTVSGLEEVKYTRYEVSSVEETPSEEVAE